MRILSFIIFSSFLILCFIKLQRKLENINCLKANTHYQLEKKLTNKLRIKQPFKIPKLYFCPLTRKPKFNLKGGIEHG